MSILDLTLFTEVDTASRISISATAATVTDLDRDEIAYAYKDLGASYFNSVSLDFEVRFTGASHGTLTATGLAASLTTTAVSAQNGFSTTDVSVMFLVLTGPLYRIRLSRGADVAQSDTGNLSTDTTYYLRLERAAASDSFTLKVYSDAARTSQVGSTLTVTGYNTATRYRYLYCVNSPNDGQTARAIDYVSQNLNLANFLLTSATASGAMSVVASQLTNRVFSMDIPKTSWLFTNYRS